MARITNSDLRKTGNDYVKRVGKGEKIKPGKGNCPANKHLKGKLK